MSARAGRGRAERLEIDCDGVTFLTKEPEKLLRLRINTHVRFCPSAWGGRRMYDGVYYRMFAFVYGLEVWVKVPNRTPFPNIVEILRESLSLKTKAEQGGNIVIEVGYFEETMKAIRRKYAGFADANYIVSHKGQKLATRQRGIQRILEDIEVNMDISKAVYVDVDIGIVNPRKTEIATRLLPEAARARVDERLRELAHTRKYWPGNGSVGMNVSFSASDFKIRMYNPVPKRHVQRALFDLAKKKEIRTMFMLEELAGVVNVPLKSDIRKVLEEFFQEANGGAEENLASTIPFRTEVSVRTPCDTSSQARDLLGQFQNAVSIGKSARKIAGLQSKTARQVVAEMLGEILPWARLVSDLLTEVRETKQVCPVKRWLLCLAEDVLLVLYDGAFHDGAGGQKPFLMRALGAGVLKKSAAAEANRRLISYAHDCIQLSEDKKSLVISYDILGEMDLVKDGIQYTYSYAPAIPMAVRKQWKAALAVKGEWEALETAEEKRNFVLRIATSDIILFAYPARVLLTSISGEDQEALRESGISLDELEAERRPPISKVLEFARVLARNGFRFSEKTKPSMRGLQVRQLHWDSVKNLLQRSFDFGEHRPKLTKGALLARRGELQLLLEQVPEAEQYLEPMKEEIAWLPIHIEKPRPYRSAGNALMIWTLQEVENSTLSPSVLLYYEAYGDLIGEAGRAILNSGQPEAVFGNDVVENLEQNLRSWSSKSGKVLELDKISSLESRIFSCATIHAFLTLGPCNLLAEPGANEERRNSIKAEYIGRVKSRGSVLSSEVPLWDFSGNLLCMPAHCGAAHCIGRKSGHISIARTLYTVYLDFVLHGKKCSTEVAGAPSLEDIGREADDIVFQFFVKRASRGFKIRCGCLGGCAAPYSGAKKNAFHDVKDNIQRETIACLRLSSVHLTPSPGLANDADARSTRMVEEDNDEVDRSSSYQYGDGIRRSGGLSSQRDMQMPLIAHSFFDNPQPDSSSASNAGTQRREIEQSRDPFDEEEAHWGPRNDRQIVENMSPVPSESGRYSEGPSWARMSSNADALSEREPPRLGEGESEQVRRDQEARSAVRQETGNNHSVSRVEEALADSACSAREEQICGAEEGNELRGGRDPVREPGQTAYAQTTAGQTNNISGAIEEDIRECNGLDTINKSGDARSDARSPRLLRTRRVPAGRSASRDKVGSPRSPDEAGASASQSPTESHLNTQRGSHHCRVCGKVLRKNRTKLLYWNSKLCNKHGLVLTRQKALEMQRETSCEPELGVLLLVQDQVV